MADRKTELPYGWIVKQSKSYPDRVYYFNVNTGASTWEFPDLIQPLLQGKPNKLGPPPELSTYLSSPDICSPTKPAPTPDYPKPNLTQEPVSKGSKFKQSVSKTYTKTAPPESMFTSKGFVTSKTKTAAQESMFTSKGFITGVIKEAKFSPALSASDKDSPRTSVSNSSQCKRLSPRPAKAYDTGRNLFPSFRDVGKEGMQASGKIGISKTKKTDSMLTAASFSLSVADTELKACSSRQSIGNRKILTASRPSKSDLSQQHKIGSDSWKQQNENRRPEQRTMLPRDNHSTGEIKDSPKSRKVQVVSRDFPQGIINQKSDSKLITKSPVKKRKISPIRSPNSSNKAMRSESMRRRVICNNSSQSGAVNSSISVDSDTRKVVKSLQLDQIRTGKRNITVKADPVGNTKILLKGKTTNDRDNLVVSTSCLPEKTDQDQLDLTTKNHLNFCSDGSSDTEEEGVKVKEYVGDKDKLLSIQSWIDNLQKGSDSPARDFYAQVKKEEKDLPSMNRSTDSGYSSVVSPKIRTERGWPGELRPCSVDDREIVAMEVDTWELPEYTSAHDLEEEEPMDIDLVLMEVRHEVKANPSRMMSDIKIPEGMLVQQGLLVVVDTNILIGNLNFLEELRDRDVKGVGKPVLYIPWIVLQELDHLKDNFKSKKMPSMSLATQTKARRAIGFLKNQFTNKHPRVVGQSPKEASAAAEEFSACCNDDTILQACLHCQKQHSANHVVLLTNDINLINKAIVSSVKAFNCTEIIEGVKSLPQLKTVPSFSTPDKSASSPCEIRTLANHSSSHLYTSPLPPSALPFTGSDNHNTEQLTVQTEPKSNYLTGQRVNSNSCCMHGKKLLNVINGPVQRSDSGEPVQKLECIPSPNPKQIGCMTESLLEEEKHYTEETLVDDILCKLKTVLKEALGKVLEVEMKKAYNDIWLEIVYKKPPWTLKDILECWKKHWIAVFGLVLNRRLEENVHSLLERFFHRKASSIEAMLKICDDCLPILQECANKHTYGETMADIEACVQAVCDLCQSISFKMTTVQSLSSLDSYLKSKLSSRKSAKSPDTQPESQPEPHISNIGSTQMSEVRSPMHQSNPVLTINQYNPVLTGTQTVPQTCVQTRLKPGEPFSNTPQQNVRSPSGAQTPMSPHPEVTAGELIQSVWQIIFKYCDHLYKALKGDMTPAVKHEVETVLQSLVPAATELRVLYKGLLEVPVQELTKCEEKFVALCNHCNLFSKQLNSQESSPAVPVTPQQFLMLFTSPQHRQTLVQFQTQLDEMLKHLYGCLNILYPDD